VVVAAVKRRESWAENLARHERGAWRMDPKTRKQDRPKWLKPCYRHSGTGNKE
jgi:hypothetical protein